MSPTLGGWTMLLGGCALGIVASFNSGCSTCSCPELAQVPLGEFRVSAQEELTEDTDFPDLSGAKVFASKEPEPRLVVEYENGAEQPVRVVFGVPPETNNAGAAGAESR